MAEGVKAAAGDRGAEHSTLAQVELVDAGSVVAAADDRVWRPI